MTRLGEDYYEIQKLLYLYCYHLDRGDFAAMAELFRRARLIMPGADAVDGDPERIVEIYRSWTRIYPQTGTPRTKHFVGNPIIDIAADSMTATCHSYIVVFQGTDTLSLQPVVAGRNVDRFERRNDCWEYSEREIFSEQFGDLSQHMLQPFGPLEGQ